MKVVGNGYVRSGLRVLQGGGGATASAAANVDTVSASAAGTVALGAVEAGIGPKIAQLREARMKGYEGDPCLECGNLTMVRNGTCLKCDSCGATSGCS